MMGSAKSTLVAWWVIGMQGPWALATDTAAQLSRSCEDTVSRHSGLDRETWIQFAHFQPQTQQEVFELIVERILTAPAQRHPTLYIDIDGTVVDPRPLVLELLSDFSRGLGSSFLEIRTRIAQLKLEDVGHGYQDSWHLAGLHTLPGGDEAYAILKKAWYPMIGTKSYLTWDILYPEVSTFFDHLERLSRLRVGRGARPIRVVMLTGRHAARDGLASRVSMAKRGLNRPDLRTECAFKPDGKTTEIFKRDYLQAEGKRTDIDPVAFFDNEPVNFGMSEPRAEISPLAPLPPRLMGVFVDTVSYTPPDRFSAGLYRIKSFEFELRLPPERQD